MISVFLSQSQTRENPIVHELMKIDKVKIQSSTVADDFATLMGAKNVALSGVGTFAMAAASMLHSNKEPIYYKLIIDRAFELYYDAYY